MQFGRIVNFSEGRAVSIYRVKVLEATFCEKVATLSQTARCHLSRLSVHVHRYKVLISNVLVILSVTLF